MTPCWGSATSPVRGAPFDHDARMRIAWTGEAGSAGSGGVAGIAYAMMVGLLERGHDVSYFAPTEGEGAHPSLQALRPRLSIHDLESWWRWDRWYSSDRMTAWLTSTAARAQEQRKLGKLVLEEHQRKPFDVIFQMSQLESFFPSELRDSVPLVVHPCTIVAVEAHWHLREWRLARRTEGLSRWAVTHAALRLRASLQGREAHKPDLLLGPSDRFAELLTSSYGVQRHRIRVLRHPVDLERFRPRAREAEATLPLELLFVSRLSTRKGLDLIVDLSHRLADLRGQVCITVIGGHTLWSDYSKLVAELHPGTTKYVGAVTSREVSERMRVATALLVPSRFEPGSIATGEALASGLPVIASSEVGPSEVIRPDGGSIFADGDRADFERAVRELLLRVRDDRNAFSNGARRVAENHFATEVIVDQLEGHLAEAAGGSNRPAR